MEPGHHFKSAITIAALAIIPHNDKHKAITVQRYLYLFCRCAILHEAQCTG